MRQGVAAVDDNVGLEPNLRPYFLVALTNAALRLKEGQALQFTADQVSSINDLDLGVAVLLQHSPALQYVRLYVKGWLLLMVISGSSLI